MAIKTSLCKVRRKLQGTFVSTNGELRGFELGEWDYYSTRAEFVATALRVLAKPEIVVVEIVTSRRLSNGRWGKNRCEFVRHSQLNIEHDTSKPRKEGK